MLAFRGPFFQYFLAVSLNEGAELAWIALWILEAFMAQFLTCPVDGLVPPSPDLGRSPPRLGAVTCEPNASAAKETYDGTGDQPKRWSNARKASKAMKPIIAKSLRVFCVGSLSAIGPARMRRSGARGLSSQGTQ